MSRYIWLFLCFSFLYTQYSFGAVNSDPRFFGVYCGNEKVCGPTIIGKRCKDIKNIITSLTYTESATGGLVHGSGTAEVGGDEVHFVIAGVVVNHGVLRGSATVAGLGSRSYWAYLSNNGTKISIHVEGQEIELSKFKCNNTFPNVTITDSPTAPVSFGQLMFFKGEVTDSQDISFPPERLVWKADDTVLLGKSSTGLSASTNTLSPGNHKITFTATDHGGLTSTATVQVTIVNKPPNEPFINSPTDNAAVTVGCNIFFSGGAYDQEDTFITGTNLVWSSNIDGIIGTGAELKDKLNTLGTHLVRLTAIDSVGESSFKEQTINVNPSTNGCPPTVKIVSPPSEGKGAVVIFSPQNITLVGSAEDSEDTPDTLQFEWKLKQISPAEPEQNIGTTTVVEDVLFEAVGTDKRFEVTFQATDTGGNSAVDKIEILVLSEPIL